MYIDTTHIVKTIDDISYIKHIFTNLNDLRQRTFLLLDEVYVKATLPYYGGIVFGKSTNKPCLQT